MKDSTPGYVSLTHLFATSDCHLQQLAMAELGICADGKAWRMTGKKHTNSRLRNEEN